LGEPDLPGFYSRQIEKVADRVAEFQPARKPRQSGNKPDGGRIGTYAQDYLCLAFSSEEILPKAELLLRKRSSHPKRWHVAYHCH
jgi:hypothetical protein